MLFTIGHSTHSAEAFATLIKAHVSDPILVDVRSHPTSRWEHFRKEEMERWLPANGVKYEWWPDLGGWTEDHMGMAEEMLKRGVDVASYSRGKFPKQRIAAKRHADLFRAEGDIQQERPVWTSQGLYDYSWFMSLPSFIADAAKLIERGRTENLITCCCEARWWCCHRSQISDYFAWRGVDSQHIMGKKLISHMSILGNRLDRYDPEIVEAWKTRRIVEGWMY